MKYCLHTCNIGDLTNMQHSPILVVEVAMRDIYNEMLSRYGKHDPTSRSQHPDIDTEIACRIVETLANEVDRFASRVLFHAYTHLMEG